MSNNTPYFANFAEWLIIQRHKSKLNRTKFAEKLGIPKTTLYRLESGQSPTIMQIYKIAKGLKQSKTNVFEKCLLDLEYYNE